MDFHNTKLSGAAPVALLKMCQSTSVGGGGVPICDMSGLKLLLPSDMSGLVDLTGLDLTDWGIEGEHLQRYLAPVSDAWGKAVHIRVFSWVTSASLTTISTCTLLPPRPQAQFLYLSED